MAHQHRYDLYAAIHKALRAWSADLLIKIGRNDWQNDGETRRLLSDLNEFFPFCVAHLAHEDTFIHPILARVQPESQALAEEEHARHIDSLNALTDRVAQLSEAPTPDREAIAHQLYLAFGEYMVIDFAHMLDEEKRHNAILWQHLTDAEIQEIEHNIVGSLSPQVAAQSLRWMLPNLTAQERSDKITGLRANAPPAVFDAVLQMLRANLTATELERLPLGAAV
jgi:hypothetical protein